MIKQPDEDATRAMSMLENNGHFKQVVRWLEESGTATDAHCRTEAKTKTLRQAQGSAQTIAEILKHFREAPSRHREKEGRR